MIVRVEKLVNYFQLIEEGLEKFLIKGVQYILESERSLFQLEYKI